MHPFQTVLAALVRADVRFVVVGDVAVALHGHLRATVDLDLVIALDEPNTTRAVGTLTDLGMRPRLPVPAETFADESVRRSWVADRDLVAFTLWHPDDPTLEVDLIAAPPIDPQTMIDAAVTVTLGDLAVPVAALEHLLAMKRLAGRTQDLADIEALEAIGRA